MPKNIDWLMINWLKDGDALKQRIHALEQELIGSKKIHSWMLSKCRINIPVKGIVAENKINELSHMLGELQGTN